MSRPIHTVSGVDCATVRRRDFRSPILAVFAGEELTQRSQARTTGLWLEGAAAASVKERFWGVEFARNMACLCGPALIYTATGTVLIVGTCGISKPQSRSAACPAHIWFRKLNPFARLLARHRGTARSGGCYRNRRAAAAFGYRLTSPAPAACACRGVLRRHSAPLRTQASESKCVLDQ